MARRFFLAALFASAVFVSSHTAAGPLLDDLLNYPIIDQHVQSDEDKTEGLGLVTQGKAKWIELSKEQPLGQTFTLGPNAVVLWRVFTGICFWPDSWQEGESVTFTLYDSPNKKNKLYSRTLSFEQKWFKWDVPFDVHVKTKPGASFFFELTHNGGGDNKINVVSMLSDTYASGKPYVAGVPQEGFDLYFVVLAKQKPDRQANLKRLFGHFNLDYPAFSKAKTQYEKGNFDAAIKEILAAVGSRTQPDSLIPKPPEPGSLDLTLANQVCDEGKLFRNPSKRDVWIEMSPQTTWREVWPDSPDYVRQNDLFAELGRAYQATGDEKYARKLNELMADYIQDNASPFEGGMPGGKWVAMHMAWRTNDAWDGFGAAFNSKSLTDDVKIAWLEYWSRIGFFAEHKESGGNQANATADSLMAFAARFPEYSRSRHWFDFGFQKLSKNSLKIFRDDGGCVEPAMTYHGLSLITLLSGIDQAKNFGLEIPAELLKTAEKACAYTAYILKPDGQVPSLGDTDVEEFRPNVKKWNGWREGEVMQGYKRFGREDLLYIATLGKQGKRPDSASTAFPDTGHYILRSDWGGENGEGFEDARYLFFRAGKYGSHGHDDLNQITLYAYGRPLLIDPGRAKYGTPLMSELSKNRSHNVLLVDDLPMNHPMPRLDYWQSNPVADFVENSYINLYPGVNHTRAILFVRPNYYVMFDTAVADEPRKMGINFWLTPPDLTIDKTSATVHSNEPDGANILLQTVPPNEIIITERKGTIRKGREERSDIPVVTFWKNAKQNASWTTILYPYPKGANVPNLTAKTENGIVTIKLDCGTDYVYYNVGTEAAKSGIVSFDAKAGLIKTDADGKPVAAAIVGGSRAVFGKYQLINASVPVKYVSIQYLPDVVEVNCDSQAEGLRIAALGRKEVLVNGARKTVDGDYFNLN